MSVPEEGAQEIEGYQAVLAEDPRSRAFGRLAEAYSRAGRYAEAIATCEGGLQHHPSFVGARLVLARCLAAHGADPARAEAEFRRVLELAPDHLAARRELADLLRGQGRMADASAVYEALLDLDPFDQEVRAQVDALRRTPAPAAPSPPHPEVPVPAVDLTEEMAQFEALVLGPPVAGAAAKALTPPPPFPAAEEADAGASESDVLVFDLLGELAKEGAFPEVPSGRAGPAPAPPKGVLATETLADLYVQQGFLGEARAIYEELVRADPARTDLQAKLAGLQPAPEARARREAEAWGGSPPGGAEAGDLLEVLEAWLLAARSRRAELSAARR